MADGIEWIALSVFIFFFLLVTVMGFFAARWKSGPVSEHLDEWGLGGRQFGPWIPWFLIGGAFSPLPYTIIGYPFVFAVMPILWKVAHAHGYVTSADVVLGIHGSRALEL